MSRGSSALAAPTLVAAKERSDIELVQDARAGDDAAFGSLYDRYRGRIASYAYGMVKDHARAEDITQDVFISALRRMRETDRPIAFKPWIYEIARNACIDHFRRGKRAEELSYDANEGRACADHWLVTSAPSPDAAVDTKQQLNDLCGAFGGLSDTHHQILLLRELEGLSYREIGERMGLSRPAVESTLFRARRRLNEEYDDLVSGRRCMRIQSIIAAASEGMLGSRDRRRMMRHLSHCSSCRNEARLMGVRDQRAVPRRRVAAGIKALLPLPWFLRRGGGDDQTALSAGEQSRGSGTVAQLAANYGPQLEPIAASWTKAAVAAVTIAAAGVGAGVAAKPERRQSVFPWSAPQATQVQHHSRSVPAAGHLRAVQRVFAHAQAVGASRTAVTLPPGERSGDAGARGSARGTGAQTGGTKGGEIHLPRVDLATTVRVPQGADVPPVKLPSSGSQPSVVDKVQAVTRSTASVPGALVHGVVDGGSSQSTSSSPQSASTHTSGHHSYH